MTRLIDMGLEKLTQLMLEMGGLAQRSVNTSIEAYIQARNLVEQIYGLSEELRKLQEEVSELSIEIIARYQPVASDLRFIKACMEISYGFSRIGRYAYDIAEVLQVWGDLSQCDHSYVEEVASVTQRMIQMSINAFAKKDTAMVREIVDMDDKVDEALRSIMNTLVVHPSGDAKCGMSTLLIIRYLERIADHASYIAEAVLYIMTGERFPRK